MRTKTSKVVSISGDQTAVPPGHNGSTKAASVKSKTSKTASISGNQSTSIKRVANLTELLPMLSLAKAAEALGMSLSWMRQQNDIPFVRIGSRKLFRQEDLVAYVNECSRNQSKRAGG